MRFRLGPCGAPNSARDHKPHPGPVIFQNGSCAAASSSSNVSYHHPTGRCVAFPASSSIDVSRKSCNGSVRTQSTNTVAGGCVARGAASVLRCCAHRRSSSCATCKNSRGSMWHRAEEAQHQPKKERRRGGETDRQTESEREEGRKAGPRLSAAKVDFEAVRARLSLLPLRATHWRVVPPCSFHTDHQESYVRPPASFGINPARVPFSLPPTCSRSFLPAATRTKPLTSRRTASRGSSSCEEQHFGKKKSWAGCPNRLRLSTLDYTRLRLLMPWWYLPNGRSRTSSSP